MSDLLPTARQVAAGGKMERVKEGECGWFMGCPRPATGVSHHPILGDVPVCDSCVEFTTN